MFARRNKGLMVWSVALLVALLVLGGAASGQAAQAKHVILIIGDGMNNAHEIAGSRYLFGQDYALSFHKLDHHYYATTWDVTAYNSFASDATLFGVKDTYKAKGFQPVYGYSNEFGGNAPWPMQPDSVFSRQTYFLKNRIGGSKPAATDSASAATALYTGVKTDDGNISWQPGDPADGAIETIGEKFRSQLGGAYGAVSTVEFNHATPATLYAHNVNRNNYSPEKKVSGYKGITIAEEVIQQTQPDVVIGAGHPDWSPKYVSQDLVAEVRANSDYVYVERVAGVDGNDSLSQAAATAAAGGKKIFGLYGGAGGDFENRMPSDTPGSPSLDRGSAENPTFANLVTSALTVMAQNPNGFFLMAEQGNLDWRNHSNDYIGMVGCVVDLHEGVRAAIDFVNQPGDNLTWDNTLLVVTSDHSNSFMRLHANLAAGDLPRQVPVSQDAYGPVYDSGSYPDGEVTYGTKEHTNELVNVYAQGSGANLFAKYVGSWNSGNIIDNTHIYKVMAEAAGLN